MEIKHKNFKKLLKKVTFFNLFWKLRYDWTYSYETLTYWTEFLDIIQFSLLSLSLKVNLNWLARIKMLKKDFFVISRAAIFHQWLSCVVFDIMTEEGGTPHPRCIEKLQEGLFFPRTLFHNNK